MLFKLIIQAKSLEVMIGGNETGIKNIREPVL
jgi:hypothetical protein